MDMNFILLTKHTGHGKTEPAYINMDHVCEIHPSLIKDFTDLVLLNGKSVSVLESPEVILGVS
jgi:hypothetical protein